MKRILIADDDPSVIFQLNMMLADYETIEAHDGREAKTMIDSERFDCFITDYQMPYFRGDEVIRYLKGKKPLTPAILITGNTDLVFSVKQLDGMSPDATVEKHELQTKLPEAIQRCEAKLQAQVDLAKQITQQMMATSVLAATAFTDHVDEVLQQLR